MPPFDFLKLAKRIGRKAVKTALLPGGREKLSTNPLGQTTIKADKRLEDLVISELRASKIPCVLVTEEASLVKISGKPEWKFVLDPLDGSENFKRGIPPYALGFCYAPIKGRADDVLESYIIELCSGEEFYARKGKGVFRDGVRVHASKVKSLPESIISLDFNDEPSSKKSRAEEKIALLGCSDYRRLGPDLVDMCYTACGGLDGFVDPRKTLSLVHASGVAILSETCIVTDEKGKPIRSKLEVGECTAVVAAGTKELHAELLSALRK
ncbi:Fructose-1,6-bisphosphatase/inositol-1-monophosphatase [uncultured archaeon]|nr:Fructose-1,6-bisphosphatase/inositol-1-monophosphatase [uncultured archaeon]